MPKVIATKPSIRFSVDVSKNKKRPISISLKTQSTYSIVDGPTLSYCDAMMHYLKGNIGTGCFAFAEAFKNSGLLLGTILAIFISIISLHVQHVLMRCSRLTKNRENLSIQPDYADTIESCFSQSKDPRFHRYAYALKTLCNLSICLTQFGFCCVYILFVSENLHQVFIENGIQIDIKLLQIYIFIPLWMSALIRQLKYIVIVSTFANFCMIGGLILTIIMISLDLPNIQERPLITNKLEDLPLFFGTVLFAFEGISLVLPIQRAMDKPRAFSKHFGILDLGIAIVTIAYLLIGFIGYWKFGEDTKGSLTLNLPTKYVSSQIIKILVSIGISLGYAIQFYVPIEVMYPSFKQQFKVISKHPIISELLFRSLLSLLVLAIALLVPNFSLLLSLIGSVCCTWLAFVLPILAEMVVFNDEPNGIPLYVWIKNSIILLVAFSGMILGGFISIQRLIEAS